MEDGHSEEEGGRTDDEHADRRNRVQSPPVLVVSVRSQDEDRDEAVAVARGKADGPRSTHADDRDDHSAHQDVHMDLAVFAKSTEEDRQLRGQRDDANADALTEVQPERRAIESESLVEE